jgi:hypothetical protein
MLRSLHVKIGKIWENVQRTKNLNKNLQDIKLAQTKCQNLSMSRLEKFGKIYKEK